MVSSRVQKRSTGTTSVLEAPALEGHQRLVGWSLEQQTTQPDR